MRSIFQAGLNSTPLNTPFFTLDQKPIHNAYLNWLHDYTFALGRHDRVIIMESWAKEYSSFPMVFGFQWQVKLKHQDSFQMTSSSQAYSPCNPWTYRFEDCLHHAKIFIFPPIKYSKQFTSPSKCNPRSWKNLELHPTDCLLSFCHTAQRLTSTPNESLVTRQVVSRSTL